MGVIDCDLRTAMGAAARAVMLADQLNEPELMSTALNFIVCAGLIAGIDAGTQKVERGLTLARERDVEDAVARSRRDMVCAHIERRDWAAADRELGARGVCHREFRARGSLARLTASGAG